MAAGKRGGKDGLRGTCIAVRSSSGPGGKTKCLPKLPPMAKGSNTEPTVEQLLPTEAGGKAEISSVTKSEGTDDSETCGIANE